MNFLTIGQYVELIKKIDVDALLNCSEAYLVYIKGKGKIQTFCNKITDDQYGPIDHLKIALNGIPLAYTHSPGCPTCASLLATGYGIENAKCKELEDISNKLNNNFIDLKTSIDDMKPLLTLLESDLYIIADMLCFPTDGNNNFFWDTPNNYTENPATCMAYLNDSDFDYELIEGRSVYLYPTQCNNQYNYERVEHYVNLFKSNDQRPRAIAYYYNQFLNFLIDGHHKACASTLLGETVNTLVIIPLSYCYTNYLDNFISKNYRFAEFIVPECDIPQRYKNLKHPKRKKFKVANEAHNVNTRKWEDRYLDKARRFPSVRDFGKIISTDISDNESKVHIQQWLSSNDEIDRRRLRALISLWKMNNNVNLKWIALSCASKKGYRTLKEDAFKALIHLKNDPEIEDFFIKYLVEDEDPHSIFRILALSYWDK